MSSKLATLESTSSEKFCLAFDREKCDENCALCFCWCHQHFLLTGIIVLIVTSRVLDKVDCQCFVMSYVTEAAL